MVNRTHQTGFDIEKLCNSILNFPVACIRGNKMPNEMKYGSVLYKVCTVFRNVLLF